MLETDREMIDFFHWMADLPRTAQDSRGTESATCDVESDTLECANLPPLDAELIRSRS